MFVLVKRKLEGPSIPELGQPTSTSFDSVTVPLNRASTGPADLGSYELQRSLDGTTWSTIATGAGIFGNPAAQYVDGGRTALTRYSYRARATDTAGRLSEFSATVSVTTQAGQLASEVPPFNAAAPTKIVNPALTANDTTIFKTIGAAVAKAVPGDIIGVAPGRYPEAFAITRGGEPGRPIYIQALDPNNKPAIDGQMRRPVIEPTSELRTGRQVALSASHIVWDSIDITNTTNLALNIGPSLYNNGQFIFPTQFNEWYTNVKILRSRFSKSNGGLFGSINVDGLFVGGCEFVEAVRGNEEDWNATSDRAFQNSAAATGFSGKNITFVENVVAQSMGEGIHCGAHNLNISYNVTGAFLQVENLVIRNCRVFDCYRSPIYVTNANNVLIERNVIYATNDKRFWFGRQAGPQGYPPALIGIGSEGGREGGAGWDTGFVGSVNVVIRNNVVMGGSVLLKFVGEPRMTVDTVKVQHNLFYKPQSDYSPVQGLIGNGVSDTSTLRNLTIENNIFHEPRGQFIPIGDSFNPVWWTTVSGEFVKRNNLWSHTPPATLAGTNDIVNANIGITDIGYAPVGPWPGLSEFDTTRIRLTNGSPAINAGTAAAGVTNDFFGTSRNATPECGPHELS